MEYQEVMTVAEYLWTRCRLLGAPYNSRRLNAVPGDFALPLLHAALTVGMDYVKCCNEQEAAAAASGDARWYHYGFVLVTYGVGMKNMIGYLSMDIAEKERTLYVSGAADLDEHGHRGVYNPGQIQLVHHYEQRLKPGEFSNQFKAIAQTGVPAAYIHDPEQAVEQIDMVLEGMEKFSCPGYLEITRQAASSLIKVPLNNVTSYEHYWQKKSVQECISNFKEFFLEKIQETAEIINESKKPIIIIGNAVRRYALKEYVQLIAEKIGAVITSTQLGIGIFSDNDPLYAGVYAGAMSYTEEIRQAVEESDCVLAIGISEREINSGRFTAKINPRNLISLNPYSIHVKNWRLETSSFWEQTAVVPDTASRIEFFGFLQGLSQVKLSQQASRHFPTFAEFLQKTYPILDKSSYTNNPLTIDLMINLLNNHFIKADMRLATDFGDCAMLATRLRKAQGISASSADGHMNTGFGFLFGAQPQKNEESIPTLMIAGDGAINMNLGGFITMKERGIRGATVIILDDKCYKTLYLLDKEIADPNVYNLTEVKYEYMSQVTGFGESFRCKTGGEFLAALERAANNQDSNTLIIAELSKDDCSPPLKGLACPS